MYEIIVKLDEEIVKKERERNIALEEEKARLKREKEIAQQAKRTKAIIGQIAMMTTRELLVSKVGEVARDSLLQRKIDIGASVLTTIGAFAIHPLLGAISVATSTVSGVIDYSVNERREQSRLEIMSGRAGYMNRSRR